MSSLESRRSAFEKRHKERQQQLAAKAAERKTSSSSSAIDQGLSSMTSMMHELNTSVADPSEFSLLISEAESLLTHLSPTLPPYHVRRFKDEINKIKNEHVEGVKLSSIRPIISEPVAIPLRPGSTRIRGLVFSDQQDVVIKPERKVVQNQPLVLENLRDCHVIVESPIASLRTSNLTNCTIKIGPVQGAAHISLSTHCHVTMTCHQLRIHQSNDCTFIVYCPSQPIIEHCKDLAFGELKKENYFYEQMDTDAVDLGFLSKNMFDQVLDFTNPGSNINWKTLD
ncbi:hypothetical protein P9112_005165 [Eukaryota sp. TZLM1-RC]